MKIRVNFLGTLSRYTGVESVDIELADGSLYGDLLAELDKRFGTKFPDKCWNRETKEFVKPISAIGASGDLDAKETPLSDNEEIHVLIPISGGCENDVSQ
jgi:molybdopterin converting factor small subunit